MMIQKAIISDEGCVYIASQFIERMRSNQEDDYTRRNRNKIILSGKVSALP